MLVTYDSTGEKPVLMYICEDCDLYLYDALIMIWTWFCCSCCFDYDLLLFKLTLVVTAAIT